MHESLFFVDFFRSRPRRCRFLAPSLADRPRCVPLCHSALLCTLRSDFSCMQYEFGWDFPPLPHTLVLSLPHSNQCQAGERAKKEPATRKLVERNTKRRYHQWNELYTYLSVQSFTVFSSFSSFSPFPLLHGLDFEPSTATTTEAKAKKNVVVLS